MTASDGPAQGRDMFIRKTATRNKSTNESYATHRLVASERTGKQVRQITLLNLGRHFDLPQADWPRLCARIDAILAGQVGLLAEPDAIETLAQRYAARLIALRPAAAPTATTSPAAGDTAAAPSFAKPAFRWRQPRRFDSNRRSWRNARKSMSPRCNSPVPARSASKPSAWRV